MFAAPNVLPSGEKDNIENDPPVHCEPGDRFFYSPLTEARRLLSGFLDGSLCRTVLRQDFLDDSAVSVKLHGL